MARASRFVMAGLDPAIHVDPRVKPGDDISKSMPRDVCKRDLSKSMPRDVCKRDLSKSMLREEITVVLTAIHHDRFPAPLAQLRMARLRADFSFAKPTATHAACAARELNLHLGARLEFNL